MPYADIELRPGDLLGSESLPEELYQVGLAYAAGIDTDVDLVEAHKWFNLAAAKGHDDAKLQRKELADLLSSDEVKIALSAARDWMQLAH